MVASLLKEAGHGRVMRVLSDDTDLFVLLVYWVWKAQLLSCSIQMERWDGSIININATCNEPQVSSVARNACPKWVWYSVIPFQQRQSCSPKCPQSRFPNLFDTLGEEGVSPDSVRETGRQFFAALYGQSSTVTMNEARHRIYTRKKWKPICIKALPPTDGNLDFRVMRAHLQMKLWKAADKQGPPNLDITKYGWTIKYWVPSPSFWTVSPAPSGPIDVLSCGCKAEGQVCSTAACLCHRNNLSCTIYCKCSGCAEICNNPSLIATPLPNPVDEHEEHDDEL